MSNNKFREQYVNALSCYLKDQEVAGLDIVTDGDCRFDQDVGGQTVTCSPPWHITGVEKPRILNWPVPAPAVSDFHGAISCTITLSVGDAEDHQSG